MLQQTTVAAVIPFFDRFIRRFPTVASLASASEDDVLTLWSGLGYYSRARNLRLAAADLVENHGGQFPRDVTAARKLRGVGPYTASAVTSIAYGARAAAVDGNVRRVLSRLHAVRSLTEGQAQRLANLLLSPRAPGSWNEAMMELGATICTPLRPRCDRCPASAHCQGRERAEYWSERKPRRATVRVAVSMALVELGGRILLIRNPARELMGGLFQLPMAGLPRPPAPALSLHQRYGRVLAIEHGAAATIRHAVTHHYIEAAIFRARRIGARPVEGAAFYTVDDALRLPLGGLTRKALRAVGLIGR